MKRFLFQLVAFVFVAYLVVYALGEMFAFAINKYGRNFLNNADYKVTEAIVRSRQHHKTKKLVIGDSVGASLYDTDDNDTVTSLAATVALTTVGQYCLMANFFNNNKDAKPQEVILILNPLCWNNTLEGGLAYSTFAKNFFNDEFKHYMDEQELSYISKWPYAWLLNQKWFALCPYSTSVEEHLPKGDFVSPQQYRYLRKMMRLCTQNGIKFSLYSGPVRESLKPHIDSLFIGKSHTKEQIFKNYYKSIKYMPDSCFNDQLHLKHIFVPKDYFKLYND